MSTIFFPQLHHTANGTPYFREAGVALVAQTVVNLHPASGFLDGFDSSLGFGEYLDDAEIELSRHGVDLSNADELTKFAGQLCYMSFGRKRTWNKDASKYLTNIKRQQHGSTMEHASFTLLFWGVDRTLTHELVRHRAGFAFSQVSQRYVGSDTLRFVMRRERQFERHGDSVLKEFEQAIDRAAREYRAATLTMNAAACDGHPMLQAESATERRKKIHQVARDLLPNCVEAPILVTGNVRAWRHMIEMRAHPKADTPIRDAAVKALTILQEAAPLCFEDYKIVDLDDGTRAAETEFRKV